MLSTRFERAAGSPVPATTSENPAGHYRVCTSGFELEGRTRQALETLAPMQDADGAPQRLKVNLGILYAATGSAERSRQLLDGRVSDGDLSALFRALATSVK